MRGAAARSRFRRKGRNDCAGEGAVNVSPLRTLRNLFAELKQGLRALRAEREGNLTLSRVGVYVPATVEVISNDVFAAAPEPFGRVSQGEGHRNKEVKTTK